MLLNIHAQQSMTLQRALQLAKTNNPDLKVINQNIPIAKADEISARLRLNPSLNIQTLHITSDQYRKDGTSWSSGYNNQYWFQVTKPFQIAGQRINRIRMAESLSAEAQLEFNEVSRNIYISVASKWIDVWAAKVNLDILLTGKRNIDSLVLINEYRFKAQVITETDLFRTQLLQQQYQRDILTATQVLTTELQNLKYLTGETDSIVITSEDSTFFNIDNSLDSLYIIAMQKRSDVLSAKNNLNVSLLNINLQKSLAYPIPEVGGMYNPQNKVPYLGFYGTIEIPIFERNQGERVKSQILKTQAERSVLATELQAKTEVFNSYEVYITQRNNLIEYKKNLLKADQILNSVRYSYLKGGTYIIDLLEAERSWLDTRQRYFSTMEDFKRSYVQILYATGSINELAE
jgi:cobalt-zinc-cadmium efflux system outer membrane protein